MSVNSVLRILSGISCLRSKECPSWAGRWSRSFMARAMQRKPLELRLPGVTISLRSAEPSALSTGTITGRFVSPRSWVTRPFSVLRGAGSPTPYSLVLRRDDARRLHAVVDLWWRNQSLEDALRANHERQLLLQAEAGNTARSTRFRTAPRWAALPPSGGVLPANCRIHPTGDHSSGP